MYIDVCKSKMNREKAAHTFLKPRLAGVDSSSNFCGSSSFSLSAFGLESYVPFLYIRLNFVVLAFVQ